MSDIIQLLPDSVANQIAAGEVIQRPASVVKELVENAIDADADEITVIIMDAGRTLVQVIDNGNGMSETDARMAFERHATSKIRMAEDLFSIRTMGFRGEALASIAAVADVELKTRKAEDDIGTKIQIKGSELVNQESTACSVGSNFSVKNLFFNIPARRKFLKGDSTEFGHILSEFKKTALAYPDIKFALYHNDSLVFKLKKANVKQRISDIFGKQTEKYLVPVDSESEILTINGYVGKPETAKKRNDEQYFFVNRRFMRHAYFYKAVLSAYEQIISPDKNPSFFIYFDIEPHHIDINIHPAKIQINFDDTQGIYQILRASVKKALGSFNVVPSIDFDREGYIEMPYTTDRDIPFVEPSITDGLTYNPFEDTSDRFEKGQYHGDFKKEKIPDNWEQLYTNFSGQNDSSERSAGNNVALKEANGTAKYFQIRNKYIATPVKSGLMLIHITRAHERIFFEDLTLRVGQENMAVQKLLYPVDLQLTTEDFTILWQCLPAVEELGFEVIPDKSDTYHISGVPAYLSDLPVKQLFEALLVQIKDDPALLKSSVKEHIAEVFAKKASLSFAKPLAPEEMQYIIDGLFSCHLPNYTNDGRKIIEIIKMEDIEKMF
jgi:DNA mismatch repair protein MutL